MTQIEKEQEAKEAIYQTVENCLKLLASSFESMGGVSGLVHVSTIKASHDAFLKNFKKGMEKSHEELQKEASKEAHDDLG